MKAINLCLFCLLLIGCANKPKQEKVPQTLINNTVGINDTLGLSLHPEFPIYSTKQKQVTFILHNNSGTDIGFGGYYSYTYEDEKEYGGMFLCSLLYLMKKLYFGKVINIITMQNYSGILPVVIVFFLQ